MRHIYIYILLALCLVSCHEQTPEEVVQGTLKEALEALERNDHDAYLRHVDFGDEMDSLRTAYMKDVLRQEVLRDKKFEQIKAKLAGVADIAAAKAKDARIDSVNQVTFTAPVFVQATGASEPALSGAVAASKQGAFSKAVVKGNGGAYLFQVLKKAERQGAKFDEKVAEQQLQQQAMQAASRFLQELYQKSDVVDNRYLFF